MPNTNFESISCYSNREDLYVVHNTQHFKASTEKKGKLYDTIASTGLKKGGKGKKAIKIILAGSKMEIVAKGGKFLFMAIALPPYLLFYGIPKWICVEALPKITKFIKIIIEKVSEKVVKALMLPFVAINRFVNKLVQQIKKAFLNTFVAPVLKVIQTVKNIVQKIQKTVNALMAFPKKFMQVLLKPLIALKKIPEFIQKQVAKIKQKVLKIQEKITQVIQKIVNFPKQFIQTIQQRVKKVIEVVQNRIMKTVERFSRMAHAITTRLQVIPKIASKITNKIQTVLTNVTNMVYQTFKPIVNFVATKVRYVSEKITEVTRKVARKIAEVTEKVTAPIAKAMNVLKDIPTNTWIAFQNSRFYDMGGKMVFSIVNVVRSIQVIVKKIAEIPKMFSGLGKKGKELVRKIKGLGDAAADRFKRGLKWLLEKGSGVPKKGKQYLQTVSRYVSRGIHGFFYYLRLAFAWIGFLIRYWMVQVQEVTISLLKL